MNILIFAGGNIRDYSFCNSYVNQADCIICADKGMEHAKNMNLLPDLIVGDFDSASEEAIAFYKNKSVPFKTFPTEKDKTDTELALEYAIHKGAKQIWIVGGIGSRMDHTLGNIHLLYLSLKSKIPATLIDAHNQIHLIDDRITIVGNKNDYVSLIPFSLEVTGVSTKGLYYPLENAILRGGSSYGVSNAITDSKAFITIKSGLLLVIKSKEL
ncbi:MAG: thiamine diphosphokinase [Epulopiscium sp.]|nr:thiamine diphosphokinase [Candidatus Epulonipiscium sp.]